MTSFRLACIQLNSGEDWEKNIAHASALVRAARAKGADLIATPENTALMVASQARPPLANHPEADHPAMLAFARLAKETGAWLLLGSLWVAADAGRVRNRSLLLRPDGTIAARYDKLHLFDVDLPKGESFRESRNFLAGEKLVLADTPFGRIGLTICYDLRFPDLYRSLAQAGAELLAVPSAFTRATGEAHWHVLLRARAIETGAYVFAPAQTGTHPGGRRTYGHSLIVAPWGEVLADGEEDVGYILADIDLAKVAQARAAIPAWRHRGEYSFLAGNGADA
jgi:predicted amidohydrolase